MSSAEASFLLFLVGFSCGAGSLLVRPDSYDKKYDQECVPGKRKWSKVLAMAAAIFMLPAMCRVWSAAIFG